MSENRKYCDYVKPVTGTAKGGNCLIGPYRPLGMVRLGPDAPFPQAVNNGYCPSQAIQGFSHLHVSGTGGAARYGNIRLTPFTGAPEIRSLPPYILPPVKRDLDKMPDSEISMPGYYKVILNPWRVGCELTVTHQAGVHRYSFPEEEESHILLDAAACICSGNDLPGQSATPAAWDSNSTSTGGWIQIISNHEIIGRTDIRGGWGHDKSYSVYYYYRSDQPFVKTMLAGEGGFVPAKEGSEAIGKGLRCDLCYGRQQEVVVQVGVSFVSVANAREAVEKECGRKTFDEIREECVSEWENLLSQYKVTGGKEDKKEIYYSLLYRLYCMPTDLGVDHENPYWKSGVRQFTDYYCMWDSIRNANSFFHLFDQALSRDIMNSLIDIAEHTGWLPDAYIANHHGYLQSACACDILFSEGLAKNIDGVDYEKALKYVCKNAEEESPDVLTKGRYLKDYHGLGYLSLNVPKGSVSRHLEYTYHDWCIAKMAAALGKKEVAEKYLEYSKRVWNLWNEEIGFFCPRKADGTWAENYNPWEKEKEAWNSLSCYEGSTAVWSFNVFQDFYGLISRMGGNERFLSNLQRIFDEKYFQIKETRMHLPHLFTYAGRPDLAAEKVLENLEQFSAEPKGIPDNEDMGCQSAYFLWQSIGLYPIYGQEHYMLTPPVFDYFEKELGPDKKIVVTAERKGEGKYIESCTLGNTPIDRAWITHKELVECGHLHFVLSDVPGTFGRYNRPPACAMNAENFKKG